MGFVIQLQDMLAYVFLCFTATYTLGPKAIKRATIIYYGEHRQIWEKSISLLKQAFKKFHLSSESTLEERKASIITTPWENISYNIIR
jgi:hypothetical protein